MTIQSFNQLNHTRSPSIIKWHWASRLGVLGLWQPCNLPFACCTKEEHIIWGEMSRRRFHESVYDALCSLINQHRVSNGWTQEPALPSFVIVCHRLSPQPIHSHHHLPNATMPGGNMPILICNWLDEHSALYKNRIMQGTEIFSVTLSCWLSFSQRQHRQTFVHIEHWAHALKASHNSVF